MKLNKTYEAKNFEADIYQLWEKSEAFRPSGQGQPYSIVMPPPNANGSLHVGHALFVAVEDILTRYHRMNGRDTAWIPGADHAGFETWVVFERALEAEGKSRFDYSRDELYEMTWNFVADSRGGMEKQLRALGASCDWKSLVFTLDPKVVEIVYATFKKMWDDGLIYRGERIVNYCTHHHTSFADIEVVFREEQGHLWEIKYLVDGDSLVEYITVATTRPETMLGDEAIAVHPDDEKYKNLVGRSVILPIVGKKIPIIADDAVELGFGTGAVKITPAHDPLDFQIGQRHGLPITKVIDEDGRMTNVPEEFMGLEAGEACQKVVERLRQEGSLGKVEKFTHQVPHCYKCGSVIQPLVKDQWFVAVEKLASNAKKALQQGKIRFVPAHKGDELIRYFDELRDWNISRQIPWGIPIPAFQNVDNPDDWIFNADVDKEYIEVDGRRYRRDDDTFDTWFSSGQWPFIVTDYLADGELKRFYPNAVMETGMDILRPWVARMIMLGLYVTGEVPFREVYLHGIVNDEHNQKMSKSKGNVIDPIDTVAEYGSDALRLGLVSARSAAQAQAFSPDKVIAGRNFCNKLWNMARFVEGQVANETNKQTGAVTFGDPLFAQKLTFVADSDKSGSFETDKGRKVSKSDHSSLTVYDHWVLSKLQHLTNELDKLIKDYRFAEAAETLYHTVWDEVADWYIEAAKQGSGVLEFVLETVLKLAHPFAPFVTETIWTTLHDDDSLLIGQQWNREFDFNPKLARDFEKIKQLVTAVRNTAENLDGGEQTLIYHDSKLVADHENLIKNLANLENLFPMENPSGLRIAGHIQAWLAADKAKIAAYKAKISAKIDEADNLAENLEKRLSSASYVKNAPKHLVKETRTQLAETEKLIKSLTEELEGLE
ncbi:MAG: valine--tRNA ligase [Candidatus Nomurabacteria bacterium]|jgi:valyl-tRNA synthetase|nr:valine--tRNA ligase [Candidatus Nomurabacteria bacterium]